MATIKVQKIPQKTETADDVLARFCCYFPQYTFAQARKIPYKRVRQMLRIAEIQRARFLRDLTMIVVAPHSRRGSDVKKLLQYFTSIIEG